MKIYKNFKLLIIHKSYKKTEIKKIDLDNLNEANETTI